MGPWVREGKRSPDEARDRVQLAERPLTVPQHGGRDDPPIFYDGLRDPGRTSNRTRENPRTPPLGAASTGDWNSHADAQNRAHVIPHVIPQGKDIPGLTQNCDRTVTDLFRKSVRNIEEYSQLG